MTINHAPETAEHTQLTVDTEGLAFLIGLGKSWTEKQVAERAWSTGKIPVPFEIAPSRRLWLRTAVVRWAEDTQARSEARFP